MVVVVQLLTGNQDAPGRNIGAGIGHLKIAVTPIMRRAIHDARRHHRCPGHLHRPHGQTGGAKQDQINHQHQAHTLPGEAAVQIALQPVIGRAMAITRHGFLVRGLFAVQLITLQQHGFDAVDMRTVRVFGLLAFGMVLAVNGGPLFGDLARGQPQPESEKMRGHRVQIKRTVRLMPMQEHRHADHGDVGHGQSEQHHLPPTQRPKSVRQPVKQSIQGSPIR